MTEGQLPEMPYKGLMPYSEEDAQFFFGRERERNLITANLMSRRFTILYGPSGVGKSSLLQAGVAHHLRELVQTMWAERSVPTFAYAGEAPAFSSIDEAEPFGQQSLDDHAGANFVVVVFNTWGGNPVTGLMNAVRSSIAQALNIEAKDLVESDGLFTDALKELTQHYKIDLFIILDQFEEYFLYPQDESEGSFAVEFPRAVSCFDLRANFLVSLREDWYARLNYFKGHIQGLFDNCLRIEHLDDDAAREAIEGPFKRYRKLLTDGRPDVSMDGVKDEEHGKQGGQSKPSFSKKVIEQLKRLAYEDVTDNTGRGVSAVETNIQSPYLQLVMTRLWNEAMSNSPHVLSVEMLEDKNKAKHIVQSHLDDLMGQLLETEKDIAASIFHYLVTPSGNKIAYVVSDLAVLSGRQEEELEPVLKKLCSKAYCILNPVSPRPDQMNVPRYQIMHDVLGKFILNWRSRYVQAQELITAEREAAKKAAKAEREATRQRELQQARALAATRQRELEKTVALAEEQHLHAESERKRLIEQEQRMAEKAAAHQRGLEQAQALVEEQQRRADLEHRRVKQFRRWFIGLVLLLLAMGGMTVFALRQQSAAAVARAEADIERNQAIKQRDIAEQNKVEAERRRMEAEEERLRAETAEEEANKQKAKAIAESKAAEEARAQEAEQRLVALAALKDAKAAGAKLIDEQKKTLAALEATEAARVEEKKQREVAQTALKAAEAARVKEKEQREIATAARRNAEAAEAKAKESLDIVYDIDSSGPNYKQIMRGHQSGVTDVVFSPDGKTVATAGADKTVNVWDVDADKNNREPINTVRQADSVTFSPDGSRVLTANDEVVKVQGVNSTGKSIVLKEGADSVVKAAFDRNNKLVAVIGKDGTGKVFDVATGNEVSKLPSSAGKVDGIAISPDAKLIATSGEDNTIRVWDAATGKEKSILRKDEEELKNPTFDPDSKLILTTSGNKAIVWDANSGKKKSTLKGHYEMVNGATFSPNGKYIVTASQDGMAWIWDTKTGRKLQELREPKGLLITHIRNSFFPVKLLGSFYQSRTFLSFKFDVLHTRDLKPITAAVFSPNNDLVVTTGEDGLVKVWEVKTGKKVVELRGHTKQVNSAAFSPSGRYIVSASDDQTARVWDLCKDSEPIKIFVPLQSLCKDAKKQ